MAAPASIDVSTQLLRKLHRIHSQKQDLEGQARRGPLQRKAVEATVAQAQAKVNEASELLKRTRMTADEKQLQLQSRESHVEELQAKLNTAASNKEFSLLKEQIAADEQANSVQNDEIFEVLERIDALEEQLKQTELELDKAKQEQTKRLEEIEARQTQVQEDLQRIELQLGEAEAEIPTAMKADYRRLIEARGEEAMAPIEDESCGGCYQTLTTQVISQVKLNKLTYCPNCNAILYAG